MHVHQPDPPNVATCTSALLSPSSFSQSILYWPLQKAKHPKNRSIYQEVVNNKTSIPNKKLSSAIPKGSDKTVEFLCWICSMWAWRRVCILIEMQTDYIQHINAINGHVRVNVNARLIQKWVNICSRITGQQQPSLANVYDRHILKKAKQMIKDDTHFLSMIFYHQRNVLEFQFVRQYRRRHYFIPASIHLLNNCSD